MQQVIDTNRKTTAALGCLKEAGIRAVVRYYNRNMTAKVIRRPEADAILAAGLSLAIVHQRGGRDPNEYGRSNGNLDAAHCRRYGKEIGQPSRSAIYFAVDFDISSNDITRFVVPYFEAVAGEMAKDDGLPSYRVGVYGSGLTCRTLLDRGLAELTWLSQSRRFRGTPEFRASNRWNLLQLMPETLCGIGIDPDIVNPANPDFGQFSSSGAIEAPAALPRFRVIARDGLRLRSGPGTEFERIGLLPLGTVIFEVRREGEWSFVDQQGDGRIDGAVHGGFLQPA